jgi:hypothetical protein
MSGIGAESGLRSTSTLPIARTRRLHEGTSSRTAAALAGVSGGFWIYSRHSPRCQRLSLALFLDTARALRGNIFCVVKHRLRHATPHRSHRTTSYGRIKLLLPSFWKSSPENVRSPSEGAYCPKSKAIEPKRTNLDLEHYPIELVSCVGYTTDSHGWWRIELSTTVLATSAICP